MTKRKYGEVEMIGALKQMALGEAQRLRQLEDENGRLKKLVADLSFDKEMLEAVIKKLGHSSTPSNCGAASFCAF